jgi:DNA-binding IscR family transcriptional regulator
MKNIDMKERLLDLIPNEKERAITSRELISLTGINFRQLKMLITELRMEYPICSKETEGGGYWIAESDKDIKEFINMISRRRDGYNKTIEVMQNHIGEEVG